MRVVRLRLAAPTCPNERELGPSETRRDLVPLDRGHGRVSKNKKFTRGRKGEEEASFLPFNGDVRMSGQGLSLVSIILNIYLKVLDVPGP